MDVIDCPQEIDIDKIEELVRLALNSRADSSFEIITNDDKGVVLQESVDQMFGRGFVISERTATQGYRKFLLIRPEIQQPMGSYIELWDKDNCLMLVGSFYTVPTPIRFQHRGWETYSLSLRRFLCTFENECMTFGETPVAFEDRFPEDKWLERLSEFWSYLRFHRNRAPKPKHAKQNS